MSTHLIALLKALSRAGPPAEHLLIWHIDTQSLARRGLNTSDEIYRLLSPHGRIADLEVYLALAAAVASFVRVQDAQKVRTPKPVPCFLQLFYA